MGEKKSEFYRRKEMYNYGKSAITGAITGNPYLYSRVELAAVGE